MSKYVQHISGQGERWEVIDPEIYYCSKYAWRAKLKLPNKHDGEPLYLPKSEYHLCESPEKWVDVTGECVYHEETHDFKAYIEHVLKGLHREVACTLEAKGYRLRKVQWWGNDDGQALSPCRKLEAFIVEKQEP